MRIMQTALASLTLFSAASFADCDAPASPVLPDGATASMQDMLEGQKAVKAFQAANMDYMGCLEKVFNAAAKDADSGNDDEKAAATEVHDKAVAAYNDAVSKEEEVAGQFNTEIREYKAANPG
ncbi:MAG: hypothetical protein AAGI11_22135 [Pseudomonadota bacterium]